MIQSLSLRSSKVLNRVQKTSFLTVNIWRLYKISLDTSSSAVDQHVACKGGGGGGEGGTLLSLFYANTFVAWQQVT